MNESHSEGLLAGKRVVFVLAGEVLGGAERGALDLASELRDREGAAVSVVALDDREGQARRLAAERGIPWTCVRTHWRGSSLHKLAALVRLARAIRRMRPDVLVSSTNAPNVTCGLTWRATGGVSRRLDAVRRERNSRFDQRLFRRALRAMPLVTTAARHGCDWLVMEYGADPRRVHVLRSACALPQARESGDAWRERLDVSQSDLVACIVAHFHSGKDHETLLRAWRLVVDRLARSETRPVVLLPGRDAGSEARVKALALDLDLGEHVRFLGEIDDVSGVLAASDLALFCSHRELFPRGVTEPMAAGLAVAGTDIPGAREALGDAGTRFLAPPGDADALADAVLRLLRDPELRAQVGRANADVAHSRRAHESTSGAYARLLSEALAARR